jgi:APA family basic amino acid/polyamine antiporter
VTDPGTGRPRRQLGVWVCTALVVGNMVGSGVFLLPASLAPYGGLSLAGWLVSSAGAMACALVFAWLARDMPREGGPYAYTRTAFGDFPAFLVAWGYWVSICAGNAAIAAALVGYLGFFSSRLAASPALGAVVAVLSVWLLTWVNHRGVREAGAVQLVTTVLKLAPLVAVGMFGLARSDWGHLAPIVPAGRSLLGAVAATVTLTLWAFLGLESATIPADEVREPERTIPRATVLGTAIAAVVYVLGTIAVMGVLSPGVAAASTAPFADAAALLWGGWAANAVAAGAAISCFGALNGWILLQGQVPLAIAADGLFPSRFARRSARGTPTSALVLSSALVTALLAANYTRGLVGAFTFIILLSTIVVLVPYAFSCLALIATTLRQRRAPTGRRIVAILALAFSVGAIFAAGVEVMLWGSVLLLAGIPVYVAVRRGAR